MEILAPGGMKRAVARVFGVLPRVLPRLWAIGALLVIIVLAVVTTTLLLASQTLQDALAEVAEGLVPEAELAGALLLWAMIPALVLAAAAVLTAGATLVLADAALTGTRPSTLRTLVSVGARLGRGIAVTVVVVAGLLALAYPAARWSLALPEVFVRGAGVRESLRTSWQRTRGGGWRAVAILAVPTVASIAAVSGGAWLFSLLPWPHAGVVGQSVLSALLSPLPFVVLTMMWHRLGGGAAIGAPLRTGSPDAARTLRGTVPAALCAVMVVSLLSPIPSARAVEVAGEDRAMPAVQVIVSNGWEGNGGLHWEYGNAGYLAGRVTSPAEQPLSGTVTLWVRAEGGTAAPVGAAVPLLAWDETATGAEGVFDATLLPVGVHWVSAEYSGDVAHQPLRSAEQRVTVVAPVLTATVAFESSQEPIRVGDLVTATVTVTPSQPLASSVNGGFALVDTVTSKEIATGTMAAGIGTAEFILTSRSINLVGQMDDGAPIQIRTGEAVVQGEAALSATLVSAPAMAEPGVPMDVTVQVTGPTGLTGAGTVVLEVAPAESDIGQVVRTVTLDAQGLAMTQICVDTNRSAPCAGPESGRVSPVTQEIRIRAHFTPHDPQTGLTASSSGWLPVLFSNESTPPAPGSCLPVVFINRGDGVIRGEETEHLGSPRVETAPACAERVGDELRRGYTAGMTITLHARPAAGMEFVRWEDDGRTIGTNPVLVWRLGTPRTTDTAFTFEPVYRPRCVPLQITVQGSGTVTTRPESRPGDLFASSNCRFADGTWGAYEGRTVRVVATASRNPTTGERDLVYGARDGSQRISWSTSSWSREFHYVARVGASVTVEFGPSCRIVEAPGAEVLSPPDCASPFGRGHLRGSMVEVALTDELAEHHLLRGWRVDGQARPELGAESRVTIPVGEGAVTRVTHDTIGCFPVEVGVREAGTGSARSRGSTVEVSPAANCGEGRWLEGTELTLTPVPGQHSGFDLRFNAWVDGGDAAHRVLAANGDWAAPEAGSQVQATGRRTLVLDAPLRTEATFYFPELCSQISIRGERTLDDVVIADTGCGPGFYYDVSHFGFLPDGRLPDGTVLTAKHFDTDLVRFPTTRLSMTLVGEERAAQGTAFMAQDSLNIARGWRWAASTPLSCQDATCSAEVRGDVQITLVSCQSIEPRVRIRLAGDATGRVYSPEDFGLQDHAWLTSDTYTCAEGVQQWLPGTRVTVAPQPPATGFRFDSWGEVPGLERAYVEKRIENTGAMTVCTSSVTGEQYACPERHEVSYPRALVRLNGDGARHPMEVNFTLSCSTPQLQAEIAIVQPAPNCPGSSAAGGLYVDGTVLHLAALPKNRSGREFVEFRGTIVPGTEGRYTARAATFAVVDGSVATLDWEPQREREYGAALAVVTPDLSVTGYYQYPKSDMEKVVDVMSKAGKFTVGAVTLTLTALTTLCAPCSAAIAVITVAEVLTRVLGAAGVADVIAWFNPVYMAECITKWGAESLPPATNRQATGGEAAKGGGAIVAGAAVKGSKSFFATNSYALGQLDDLSASAKATGAAATLAIGVLSHEFYNFNFTNANQGDLRDTANFISCVTNTYSL